MYHVVSSITNDWTMHIDVINQFPPSICSHGSIIESQILWRNLYWLEYECLFILFMRFSRQEYWSDLPFSSPGLNWTELNWWMSLGHWLCWDYSQTIWSIPDCRRTSQKTFLILSTWQTHPWVRVCLFLRSWRSQWNHWRRGAFVVNEGQHPKEGGEKGFSLVQFSCSVMSDSLWPHGLHARLPCPSPTSTAYSNSCPSSWWCHPAISSSVGLFSLCLRSCPASGSFLMSPFFTSGGQSIGVSASASSFQWVFRTNFL